MYMRMLYQLKINNSYFNYGVAITKSLHVLIYFLDIYKS